MKKTWLNPEMEALEVKETAGGPIFTGESDDDWTFNKETNSWWQEGGAKFS